MSLPDIQKTAELIQEMTAASNEQNSGAEHQKPAGDSLQEVRLNLEKDDDQDFERF